MEASQVALRTLKDGETERANLAEQEKNQLASRVTQLQATVDALAADKNKAERSARDNMTQVLVAAESFRKTVYAAYGKGTSPSEGSGKGKGAISNPDSGAGGAARSHRGLDQR